MQHFYQILKSPTLKEDFPNQDKHCFEESKMRLCLLSTPDVKIRHNILQELKLFMLLHTGEH